MESRKRKWYRKSTRDRNFHLQQDSGDESDSTCSASVHSDSSATNAPKRKCMNDSDESASSSFENEESSPVSDIVEPLAESSSNDGTEDSESGDGLDHANNLNLLNEDEIFAPVNVGDEGNEDKEDFDDVGSSSDHSVNSARSESENSSEPYEDDDSGTDVASDEDSQSSASDDDEMRVDDQPLYNGARVSLMQSLLTILTFALSHKLTGVCIQDLLSLIALHCPQNSNCIKSLHLFKKYFKMVGKEQINCHFFCSVCEVPLASKTYKCIKCKDKTKPSFFIELSIINQLQCMFKRPGFLESLRFRFNRTKKIETNYEDVYDGLIYRQLVESGFLADPNNLSFFGYFDGLSIYKSSNFSIWPLYLSINELRYKDRTKKENIVLAGLWFGSHPNPNLFLKPIYEQLETLQKNGHDFVLPDGETVRVKARMLAAVGDLPAKATFMRFTHHNGLYSCFNCMSPGARCDVGKTTVQVYPYRRDLELRNNDDVVEFARLATEARQRDPEASVYGIRGPTLLSAMLLNLICCLAIDIMHGAFLGVMKTLLHLWFDSKHSTREFSISGYVEVVDARMKKIKPPSFFQRYPRSIKKDLALFKAADYKIFMHFYSLVVLQGILPQRYWEHLCKFVSAIYLLCQDSISSKDIDHADDLLHSFVSDFAELYDIRYLGLNVHQLLHLPFCVRNLGPAWVYSCFFYESLNGELASLVHGTRHAALQIVSSCSVYMNLSVMIESTYNAEVKEMCLKLMNRGKTRVKITENIDHLTFAVGKYKKCNPVPNIIKAYLRNNFDITTGKFKEFYRLKKKGVVYSSENYKRSIQKMSCYALIEEGRPYVCRIKSFVKWSACNDECQVVCVRCMRKFMVIVSLYERVNWEIHDCEQYVNIPYLHKVIPSGKYRVFPIEAIKSVCLYMPVDDKEYIAYPVNSLEME